MALKKIRIGLLLEAYAVPAWIFTSVEKIVCSDSAEFGLIVIAKDPMQNSRGAPTVPARGCSVIYTIFDKIDQLAFKRNPDAFAVRNLRELLPNAPAVEVEYSRGEGGLKLREDEVDAIRGHDLDVLVDCGTGDLRGRIVDCAKYGVWACHHGDIDTYRGGPAGFWEVMERSPVTGSGLYRVGDGSQDDTILDQSWYMTYRLSPSRNRNFGRWMSSLLLPRAVSRLSNLGDINFCRYVERYNRDVVCYDRSLYQEPSGFKALRLVFGHLFHVCLFLIQRRLYEDKWILMLSLDNGPSATLSRFQAILPPKDKFWADPHLVYADDK